MTSGTNQDVLDRLDGLAEMIRDLERKFTRQAATAITAKEVAERLSISIPQVYEYHHRGIINGFRFVGRSDLRFSADEIRDVVRRLSEERANT